MKFYKLYVSIEESSSSPSHAPQSRNNHFCTLSIEFLKIGNEKRLTINMDFISIFCYYFQYLN